MIISPETIVLWHVNSSLAPLSLKIHCVSLCVTSPVIIIAPDVTAELGMSPTNNLKVTCHAFQAWGWTYMSLSRYEGTGRYIVSIPGVEYLVQIRRNG